MSQGIAPQPYYGSSSSLRNSPAHIQRQLFLLAQFLHKKRSLTAR